MDEMTVIEALKECGVDVIASLPCDRNKVLTDILSEHFRMIELTREEDGVGICAGISLTGKRAVMSIQSSGIGNMLNAMLSLTRVYRLPLPILASWRGTDDEQIEAQIPFNSKLPDLLDVYGICYEIIGSKEELTKVKDIVSKAYSENIITVALIKPECWSSTFTQKDHGPRCGSVGIEYRREFPLPVMSRMDSIKMIMNTVKDDVAVVSNIGVPSKEVHASRDRPMNFYMLGSYTQATPIGLGIALMSELEVVVIDGDGSLLGSSVLSVVSKESPKNLTIICLDNGTFGSTGDQRTCAYSHVDMELIARSFGLKDTEKAWDAGSIENSMNKVKKGTRFIHVPIRPGNSDSPNIKMKAEEIKIRFMDAVKMSSKDCTMM